MIEVWILVYAQREGVARYVKLSHSDPTRFFCNTSVLEVLEPLRIESAAKRNSLGDPRYWILIPLEIWRPSASRPSPLIRHFSMARPLLSGKGTTKCHQRLVIDLLSYFWLGLYVSALSQIYLLFSCAASIHSSSPL